MIFHHAARGPAAYNTGPATSEARDVPIARTRRQRTMTPDAAACRIGIRITT
jgi:hypothetical protein